MHRDAIAWRGRGAMAAGLSGSVEPSTLPVVLEGRVPRRRRIAPGGA